MNLSHRRIIALVGTRDECHAAACSLIGEHPAEDIVWIGDEVPVQLNVVPFARRQQLLGDEYGIAVIDGWAGFDPDQFGAVSGTLRGGGVLLLLLPPLNEWAARPDPAQQRITVWPHTPATMPNHFIERVIGILQHHSAVEWHSPNESAPAALTVSTPRESTADSRTADQQQAIDAIHHLMHGHRRRPLVLMADRGRGKSAALGIAAAELASQGVQRIIVTAPHRNAVSSLLAHAGDAPIEFIPPDELLRQHVPCDLLLIDEAAAIPAPMLEQLLQRHARIVFASTVHGYEGSGRGFALRFFKTLDALTPGWKLLPLSEPIRWAPNDPLERLTYALLLLDAAPAGDELFAGLTSDTITYTTLSSQELMRDTALLTELFGLLVLAHYRTTPLDLRQLLDSPNLTIHVARYRTHIAGTAITLREGGFDAALAAQIYSGTRRPRGHLAPQSLAFHCGLHDAPPLVTERIMRVAVHPAVQGRGIGTALLHQVTTRARTGAIDYLSTSFGATHELLQFWQRNTFLPVRIGFTREASSGCHSALLLQPLSPAAMALFARARQRFLAYLPDQLSEPLSDLAPSIAAHLLRGELPESSASLDEYDWRDLYSFAFMQRSYEACLGALHKLMRQAFAQPLLMDELTAAEHHLLIAKVLQRQSWREVNAYCQTTGREETVKLMRRAIGRILQVAAPDWMVRFTKAMDEGK